MGRMTVRSVECSVVRSPLALAVDIGGRHRSSCLRCQAISARDQVVSRRLSALRAGSMAVPELVATRFEHRFSEEAVGGRPSRTALERLTAPAVTAATAGLVLVLALRRRSHQAA